jgi:hypothetical protein
MMAKHLRPLLKAHGEVQVLAEWRRYLARTAVSYVSLAKFQAGFGQWGLPGQVAVSASARGSAAVRDVLRETLVEEQACENQKL